MEEKEIRCYIKQLKTRIRNYDDCIMLHNCMYDYKCRVENTRNNNINKYQDINNDVYDAYFIYIKHHHSPIAGLICNQLNNISIDILKPIIDKTINDSKNIKNNEKIQNGILLSNINEIENKYNDILHTYFNNKDKLYHPYEFIKYFIEEPSYTNNHFNFKYEYTDKIAKELFDRMYQISCNLMDLANKIEMPIMTDLDKEIKYTSFTYDDDHDK